MADMNASSRASVFLVVFLSILIPVSNCKDCIVDDEKRVDCGWHGIDNSTCTNTNKCCWRKSKDGIPWCFYDESLSRLLKSVKACEDHPPVTLACNSSERISIHDVFYGRNGDDSSCHNSGSLTCFNPNATSIVKSICKTNSTCHVSPIGNFWNFSKACDNLNAQLKIHYICVARGSVIRSETILPSSVFHHSTSKYVHFNSSLVASHSKTMHHRTSAKTDIIATSTAISLSNSATKLYHTTSLSTISSLSTSSSTCKQSGDIDNLSREVKKKDTVIIGLSAAISIMALMLIILMVLMLRKKIDFSTKANSSVRKTMEAEISKENCYDVMELEKENPYYDATS